MLVLTRKLSEQIILDIPASKYPRQVVVTQVWIGPNSSRIGIDAPDDVTILRGELLEDGKPATRLGEKSND